MTVQWFAVAEEIGGEWRSVVRLGREDMDALGVSGGDIVEIQGARVTAGRVLPAWGSKGTPGLVALDRGTRRNAGVEVGGQVQIRPVKWSPAARLWLGGKGGLSCDQDAFLASLVNLPVVQGDILDGDYIVARVEPEGVVVVGPVTRLEWLARATPTSDRVTYRDIGGLGPELAKVRELVELPLRRPELFAHLGIEAPRGILLYGPPGTGKTLIARAVANETAASFFAVSGPEIMDKFYGQSEARLREVFDQARRGAPSVIFLDELDAIAPKRDQVTGEVEKRVVAQLLALMDGLDERGSVIVIGATNLPDLLDPALRRPGRFDREIRIGVPDAAGRLQILQVHTRWMPCQPDVDLPKIAELTPGFVGADLQALCREAALVALRRFLAAEASGEPMPLSDLRVTMDDFLCAARDVEPSALREFPVEVPRITFGDVGGLAAAKAHLSKFVIWPLRYPGLYRQAGLRVPRGVLLSGPPGCGKTILARAVAGEAKANFLYVKGPSLLSRWLGESERALREVFRRARQAAPAIIFFDEIDSWAGNRHGDPIGSRLSSQLQAEFDGLESSGDVCVLAATNRAEFLDHALLRPGRFDLHIAVSLPTTSDRAEIWTVCLKGRPIEEGLDCQRLAALSEGMSGAEIAAAVQMASLNAVHRVIAGEYDQIVIRPGDLERALAEVGRKTP